MHRTIFTTAPSPVCRSSYMTRLAVKCCVSCQTAKRFNPSFAQSVGSLLTALSTMKDGVSVCRTVILGAQPALCAAMIRSASTQRTCMRCLPLTMSLGAAVTASARDNTKPAGRTAHRSGEDTDPAAVKACQ